jgi:hypothetical protein
MSSEWIAVPLHDKYDAVLKQKGWHLVDPNQAIAWTDQKSSLLTALRSAEDDQAFLRGLKDKAQATKDKARNAKDTSKDNKPKPLDNTPAKN